MLLGDKPQDITVVGGVVGACIHTPGHTRGSTCFHFPELGVVCTGDTLFKMNIGRTDLMDGSFEEIEASIRGKLYRLPKETTVIPGHGSMTTIALEKNFNTFFTESEDGSDAVKPNKTTASAFDPRTSTSSAVGFCCHGTYGCSHL